MKRLVKVGLTGGIATGKSITLQQWERAGVASIDADVLAHRALLPHTPTWIEVVRAFGDGILNEDQTVNRRRLGEIVFADEPKRLALNRIIHPAVEQAWKARVQELEQAGQTGFVVVSIPLLYEVAADGAFDRVIVVGCSESTQLARLGRKGFDETHGRARIRAQWPLSMKLDRADFVVWNDGSLRVLSEQAQAVWENMKEDCHAAIKN